MNERVMQKRWTRATQMIFMAAMLSGSAACNTISGADSIHFTATAGQGTTSGAGSGTDSTPPEGEEKREQIRCGDGEVMVGIEGRYGSWIDSVSVNCAELKDGGNDGGNLGAPHSSMAFGASETENQTPYFAPCEPGQVVGALDYTHDKLSPLYIFQVRVGCATVSERKNSVQVNDSKYGGINFPDRVAGTPISLACNQGEIANGVDVVVGEDQTLIHVRSFASLNCIAAPLP